MRQELADIAAVRKVKIDQLQLALGNDCEQVIARELMKQLVMDGRGEQAKLFADSYTARCGSDPIVEKWGTAPAPTAR